MWNDFTAVFIKDTQFLSQFPDRIIDQRLDIENAMAIGRQTMLNHQYLPEDQRRVINSLRK